MTLHQQLEDFDNPELTWEDRVDQLEEAVAEYNEVNGTEYDVRKEVERYLKGK